MELSIDDLEMKKLWQSLGHEVDQISQDAPGYQAAFVSNGWIVMTGARVADLNMALLHGISPQAWLEDCVNSIKARQIPGVVFLTDNVSPSLTETTLSLGLEDQGVMPHMARRSSWSTPRVAYVDISMYKDEASLRAATEIQAQAFGFDLAELNMTLGEKVLNNPAVQLFVGRDAGRPVSTVMTIGDGKTRGVWNMATNPGDQGRGFGSAVLAQALNFNPQRYKLDHLLATTKGESLYRRFGFRPIGTSSTFTWKP